MVAEPQYLQQTQRYTSERINHNFTYTKSKSKSPNRDSSTSKTTPRKKAKEEAKTYRGGIEPYHSAEKHSADKKPAPERKKPEPEPSNPEEALLEIISQFRVQTFRDIAGFDFESLDTDTQNGLSNIFISLVSIIIYEKNDEPEGLDQLLNYISKPYEVYQHLLILKSCADL